MYSGRSLLPVEVSLPSMRIGLHLGQNLIRDDPHFGYIRAGDSECDGPRRVWAKNKARRPDSCFRDHSCGKTLSEPLKQPLLRVLVWCRNYEFCKVGIWQLGIVGEKKSGSPASDVRGDDARLGLLFQPVLDLCYRP